MKSALALGDLVVTDSAYHRAAQGQVGAVVRLFVQTRRDRCSCNRDACDDLCEFCDREGAYWMPPVSVAEVRTAERTYETSASARLVDKLHDDRGQMLLRQGDSRPCANPSGSTGDDK